MVVSSGTLGIRRLRRSGVFLSSRSVKVKVNIIGRNVEMKLRLVLWAGGHVPTILSRCNRKFSNAFQAAPGAGETSLLCICDVPRIEEAGRRAPGFPEGHCGNDFFK